MVMPTRQQWRIVAAGLPPEAAVRDSAGVRYAVYLKITLEHGIVIATDEVVAIGTIPLVKGLPVGHGFVGAAATSGIGQSSTSSKTTPLRLCVRRQHAHCDAGYRARRTHRSKPISRRVFSSGPAQGSTQAAQRCATNSLLRQHASTIRCPGLRQYCTAVVLTKCPWLDAAMRGVRLSQSRESTSTPWSSHFFTPFLFPSLAAVINRTPGAAIAAMSSSLVNCAVNNKQKIRYRTE